MTISTVTTEAIAGVADLKAGYTLGHADVAILKALAAELLAVREAQSEAVGMQYRVQVPNVTGWSLWHNGDGDKYREHYEVQQRLVYAAPPAPAVTDERLIGIANHMASAAGGLPSEWQDWADEIVSDLRRLASTPALSVPDERAAFNAWNNEDNLPIAGVPAKNAAWLAWQARAALQAGNSPVIPDGWKLVPIVELTEKMVIHGFESEAFEALADAVLDKKGWPYSCRESAECVTGIFKAMVEVAPSPGGPDDSHATAT